MKLGEHVVGGRAWFCHVREREALRSSENEKVRGLLYSGA